jgi:hypothetical protein
MTIPIYTNPAEAPDWQQPKINTLIRCQDLDLTVES